VTDARLGLIVRRTGILAAVWTAPVVIGIAGHYFGLMAGGEGMPPAHIIGSSFAVWYVWIPATLAILWVHRKLGFSARTWPIAVMIHVGILAAVFFGQGWLTLVVGHATGHVGLQVTFRDRLMAGLMGLLPFDALIYGGVVAVGVGLEFAQRYRERDLRASHLETLLEHSRLEALQMQLQPHFLFNALNSIAMLVRRDRKQEALDVVIGFGELLRYVLEEAGTIDQPLAEELRFVRRYLEIERVRHQERLRVAVAVAPAAERALVPNLLLQPLVENALKHGISHLPKGGEVRISAERRGTQLHIEVENDGPVLPDGFSLDAADGVGLRNLRDRLHALLGEEARLTIASSASGHGVLAAVDLPFREGARETMQNTG
jgi:two-component system LytT family sensor kinase